VQQLIYQQFQVKPTIKAIAELRKVAREVFAAHSVIGATQRVLDVTCQVPPVCRRA